MKANELMIGDWVEPHQCRIPTVYCKVEGIYHDGTVNLDKAERLFTLDELEPIPLVPEILEKNGFEYKKGEVGMYGVEIVPHYIRDDVPFEVFCDGEPFAIWFKEPVDIKYVHQLQHALRLCNVSKEIVL